MSQDIVYRLRTWKPTINSPINLIELIREAADTIEQLMDDVDCYEGMKEGAAIRIADLEKRLEGGGGT